MRLATLLSPMHALGIPILKLLRQPRPAAEPAAFTALPAPDSSAPDSSTPAASEPVFSGARDMAGRFRTIPRTDVPKPPVSDDEHGDEYARLYQFHDDMGFPNPIRPGDPLRAPYTQSVAALRFMMYLKGSRNMKGVQLTYPQLQAAYRHFCRLDHRKPTHFPHLVGELVRLPGVVRRELEEKVGDKTLYTRVYAFGVKAAKRRRKVKTASKKTRRDQVVDLGQTADVVPLKLAA